MRVYDSNVRLIGYTHCDGVLGSVPSIMCYIASTQCYGSKPLDEFTPDNLKKKLFPIIKSGHTSILEHASVTFEISNISRNCSHQIVRHRIASYTQESQRYKKQNNSFVIPMSIRKDKELEDAYENCMETGYECYKSLIDESRIPKEDARYILPSSFTTSLIVTMNYRSLVNFFGLRLCTRAQWEVRGVAEKMFALLSELDPVIFGSEGYCKGPKCCITLSCEERNPCGYYKKFEEK